MFIFENLNSDTRKFMLEAIEEAEKSNNIYLSTRFTDKGKKEWITQLKLAATEYNEHWLAFQLEKKNLMKIQEIARKPLGGYTIKFVPTNATLTFSEGQFNRFYILGLCKYARKNNIPHLVIYRAKETQTNRIDSDQLIGSTLPINVIESQLKNTQASFKSKLVRPNSGISMKIPD